MDQDFRVNLINVLSEMQVFQINTKYVLILHVY